MENQDSSEKSIKTFSEKVKQLKDVEFKASEFYEIKLFINPESIESNKAEDRYWTVILSEAIYSNSGAHVMPVKVAVLDTETDKVGFLDEGSTSDNVGDVVFVKIFQEELLLLVQFTHDVLYVNISEEMQPEIVKSFYSNGTINQAILSDDKSLVLCKTDATMMAYGYSKSIASKEEIQFSFNSEIGDIQRVYTFEAIKSGSVYLVVKDSKRNFYIMKKHISRPRLFEQVGMIQLPKLDFDWFDVSLNDKKGLVSISIIGGDVNSNGSVVGFVTLE